jgi:hypothetical protein
MRRRPITRQTDSFSHQFHHATVIFVVLPYKGCCRSTIDIRNTGQVRCAAGNALIAIYEKVRETTSVGVGEERRSKKNTRQSLRFAVNLLLSSPARPL